jgi:putative flippase GtrA
MLRNLPDGRRAMVQRVIRYCSVSAISTVVSVVALGFFIGVLGYPAILSNILATAIATIPSFELNRRWVWAQSGERSILRQAVPYALLSFVGLIVSTFAVHLAADATVHSSRLVHTLAAELANIGSYGSLWLIQFALCDRVLFRSAPRTGSAQLGSGESGRQAVEFDRGDDVTLPPSLRGVVAVGQ